MTAASDDLLQVDRLLASINRNLDAMYVKLGKIVVAAETVNEALSELPSPAYVSRLLEIAARRQHSGVDDSEPPADDCTGSGS